MVIHIFLFWIMIILWWSKSFFCGSYHTSGDPNLVRLDHDHFYFDDMTFLIQIQWSFAPTPGLKTRNRLNFLQQIYECSILNAFAYLSRYLYNHSLVKFGKIGAAALWRLIFDSGLVPLPSRTNALLRVIYNSCRPSATSWAHYSLQNILSHTTENVLSSLLINNERYILLWE